MIPVLSRTQMREYDKHAIEVCHVPGLVLMENAGRGAADAIGEIVKLAGARIVVVCGAGNNGGDGFVVARHLLARRADVTVFLLGSSETVTGEARINHDAYIDLGGTFVELPRDAARDGLAAALASAEVIVDAVFGTGLGRAVGDDLAAVFGAINAARGLVVSLDLPSGLDADTGAPLGSAVVADHTVTFGHLKVGLLTPEGARLAGRVKVVDLGVPDSIVDHTGLVASVLERGDVASWLLPREANVHKHAAGNVAIVAGSPGKIGAALLAAAGALRGGAGLATVISWEDAIGAIESRALELMTGRIARSRIEESLDQALKGKTAVAIGPGLGLDDDARRAVDHVVLRWEGTKIVDADAITHFAGRADELAGARGKLVLTPHPGELGRLLGVKTDEIEKDRFGAVREIVKRTGHVVVLKGARTIIGSPSGLIVNVTGNPALATAGSGDVLTGITSALACQLGPERAAAAGVFVHGAAADRWSAAHGHADRGMLASDIAAQVPATLAELVKT